MNDIKPQSRYEAEKTKRLFDKNGILKEVSITYKPSETKLTTFRSEYFNGWELWVPAESKETVCPF